MGEQKNKKTSEEDVLKEAEEMLKKLDNAQTNEVEKSEVANNELDDSQAEKTDSKDDSVEAKEDAKSTSKKSVKKTKQVVKGPKIRSKKYQEKRLLVDKNVFYNLKDALELIKNTSYTKFDASVEMHIKLNPPKNKKIKQEQVRGMLQLVHSTGKEPNVVILDEALVEQILKDKKTSYDILIATPDMMPKIARLAKILGPQGKMPNPKTGTVTADPQKAIAEIKSGRAEYKSDNTGNIHLMFGKVSFDTEKLEENYKAVASAVGLNKISRISLSATMGPGVKVKL
jgi:large subunit ribosomal protein L1